MADSRVSSERYSSSSSTEITHASTEGEEVAGTTQGVEESVMGSTYITRAESEAALRSVAGYYTEMNRTGITSANYSERASHAIYASIYSAISGTENEIRRDDASESHVAEHYGSDGA